MTPKRQLRQLIGSLERKIPLLEKRLSQARISEPDTPEVRRALTALAVELAERKADLVDLKRQLRELRA